MKLTQRRRLRELFEARPEQWVPLPEILEMKIAQFGARILELRREGMNIANRVKIVDGKHCSCYKFTPEARVQKEMEFVK